MISPGSLASKGYQWQPLVMNDRRSPRQILAEETYLPLVSLRGEPSAAELLGLSPTSAYRLAKENKIPTIAVGHRLRVSTAALRKLLGEDDPGAAA
jgi:excisionase family DNA binding protein